MFESQAEFKDYFQNENEVEYSKQILPKLH